MSSCDIFFLEALQFFFGSATVLTFMFKSMIHFKQFLCVVRSRSQSPFLFNDVQVSQHNLLKKFLLFSLCWHPYQKLTGCTSMSLFPNRKLRSYSASQINLYILVAHCFDYYYSFM